MRLCLTQRHKNQLQKEHSLYAKLENIGQQHLWSRYKLCVSEDHKHKQEMIEASEEEGGGQVSGGH